MPDTSSERPRSNERGYTLIELLVSLFIIGILITVGVVSYLSFRDRGNNGAARAGVRAIAPSIEAYFADNGTYSGMTVAELQTHYDQAIAPSLYVITGVTQSSYCVQATSGDKSYKKAGPGARIVPGVC